MYFIPNYHWINIQLSFMSGCTYHAKDSSEWPVLYFTYAIYPAPIRVHVYYVSTYDHDISILGILADT